MIESSREATHIGSTAPDVAARRGAVSIHQAEDVGMRGAAHPDDPQAVIDTLLIVERLAITFYYTALTSPAIMHDHRLGGPSADPNNPGLPPGGDPSNVRFLQAALDAEVKHAAALVAAGAVSPYGRFHFPTSAFTHAGSSVSRSSFLGVLEIIERVCVGAYAAAVDQFLAIGRTDLATVAAQIMGVEAEHRVLGRVIAAMHPPNNLTIEGAPFAAMDGVRAALDPFLTGKRYLFADGATRVVTVPAKAQTHRVIGPHGTRRVSNFLLSGG